MSTLWDLDRKPRLLVVEHDIDIANLLRIYFSPMAEVTVAARPEEALSRYFSDSFDLIILDMEMPGLDANELMSSIQAAGSRIPVLFLIPKGISFEPSGTDADDTIGKPFDIEELSLSVKGMLSRLAGDTTTDAPPPEKKKKGKGGNHA